ncbi:MAG: hypothetical protein ACJASM_002692 [Salibacteraceae bacterium]|jgi:hypothetical protein
MNKSTKSIFYLIIFSGTIISSCKSNDSKKVEKSCIFSKAIDSTYIVGEKSETIGNFGDCKLIDFQNEVYIVANLDSELSIRKINDSSAAFKVTNPIVSSSWLDVIEDKGSMLCVTSSFEDKSLRLYKIDMQSLNVNLIATVLQYDEQLLIDPTILKVGGKYLITYTQIKGNINNGDTLKSNGHYEVVLVESNDLINWKEVSSIISEDTNIEDGFLYFEAAENSLFFLYEEEVFDKKKSAIKIKKSTDRGVNWDEPITLLNAIADQEPGAIFKCKGKKYLFYSSDLDNLGASYYGAKGYVSSFRNSNYTPDQIDISLKLDYGVLLYDVMLNNNKMHFLAKKMRKDNSSAIVHYTFE